MSSRIPFAWRPGRYLRNSGTLFAWLAVRAVAQAAMVVLLSRTLGASGYGEIVTLIAVSTLLAPFCGLGLPSLLLRDGSRFPERLPAYLGAAFRVWALSAIGCTAAAWAAMVLIVPIQFPAWITVPLLGGEIAAAGITDLLSRYEQAQKRFASFGALNAGASGLRLACVLGYCMVAGEIEPAGVVLAYSAGTLLFVTVALLLFRPWRQHESIGRSKLFEAFPFVVASLSLRVQAEFNKPALAWSGFHNAGQFSAAQRAVDLVTLPLWALQEALWPKIFSSANFTVELMRTALALVVVSLLLGLSAAAAAPLLPLVLGPDFTATIPQVQALALLPALQVVRNVIATRLTHLHQTRAIGFAYALGIGVAAIGTLVLVPWFGWRGAVSVAYGSELVLIAAQLLYRSDTGPRQKATAAGNEP